MKKIVKSVKSSLGNRNALGERVVRPMYYSERSAMEATARRAELAQLRLEEKRRRVYGLAADTVLVASGVAGLIAVQGLSAGRLLDTLIGGVLALAGWVSAVMVRGG